MAALTTHNKMSSPSSFIAIGLILSCALVGGYASMGLAYRHGFFDAVGDCLRVAHGSAAPGVKCGITRSHQYHRISLTGIAPVDGLFSVLFEFFALGLTNQAGKGKIDYEAILASTYMATLFFGGWYLMAMEGLRKRNQGRLTAQ